MPVIHPSQQNHKRVGFKLRLLSEDINNSLQPDSDPVNPTEARPLDRRALNLTGLCCFTRRSESIKLLRVTREVVPGLLENRESDRNARSPDRSINVKVCVTHSHVEPKERQQHQDRVDVQRRESGHMTRGEGGAM